MKTTKLTLMAFTAMLFVSQQLSAQMTPTLAMEQGTAINHIINDWEIEVPKDTVAQFKLFTGKHCEGKTYLNWNVANQSNDGRYVIYRSSDGEHYEVIGLRKGIGVPFSQPIAYYFTDESPCDGTATYKIIHFGMNKCFLISDMVNVTINYPNLGNL